MSNEPEEIGAAFARAAQEEERLCGRVFSGGRIEKGHFPHLELEQVRLVGCVLTGCVFESGSFVGVTFERCELTGCRFENGYFRDSSLDGCRADGADFRRCTLRATALTGGSFRYANFANTLWDGCRVDNVSMRDCSFSESKRKACLFAGTDFTRADFFKSPLKGQDLTSCVIDGILVSDRFTELRGAQVTAEQAVALAAMLGVKVTG